MVQPTKMTLARQRVLSSSEVRASDLEHGRVVGSNPMWGSDFFCPLMVDSLHLPLFSFIISVFLSLIVSFCRLVSFGS